LEYSTQELIEILEAELRANWQGKRLLMSSESRIDNPVIAKAIDLGKVSKVFAYQDFRSQIHQYQKEHQVSGIVWRLCGFRGMSISVPELHNQLTLIPGDKEILMAAKRSIIDFWNQATTIMKYFQFTNRTQYHQISPEIVDKLISQAEWLEIDSGCEEVYLSTCWGNPLESQYTWAKPQSGCDRLVATETQPSGINIY
jgi:hypothetical protein